LNFVGGPGGPFLFSGGGRSEEPAWQAGFHFWGYTGQPGNPAKAFVIYTPGPKLQRKGTLFVIFRV